jgi:hypothetical protein
MSNTIKIDVLNIQRDLEMSPIQPNIDYILFGSCFAGLVHIGLRSSITNSNQLHAGHSIQADDGKFFFHSVIAPENKALLVLLCKADEVPLTKMNPSMVLLRPIDCLSIHSASFQAVMPAQGTLLHQNMAAFLSFANEMAQSKTIFQRYLSFPQRKTKIILFLSLILYKVLSKIVTKAPPSLEPQTS